MSSAMVTRESQLTVFQCILRQSNFTDILHQVVIDIDAVPYEHSVKDIINRNSSKT